LNRTKKMAQEHSKRYRKGLEQVEAAKAYQLKEAVGVLNKFPKAKFNETVDLAFKLGVDPKQSDQMVRGTVPLPTAAARSSASLYSPKARLLMPPAPPVLSTSASMT